MRGKIDPDRTRLYLARHGEVVNHSLSVYNGQMDVDITPHGVKQMERLREYLKDRPLAAVYSSDLLRARRGAEIIASDRGLAQETFPHFREMHFGRWQGLSYNEVRQKYPGDIPAWMKDLENYRIPGGESFADIRQRGLPKLQELIARHRGQEFVLVCHGALNRVILAEALGLDISHLLRIEQDYGCLNWIEYLPDWSLIKLMNG